MPETERRKNGEESRQTPLEKKEETKTLNGKVNRAYQYVRVKLHVQPLKRSLEGKKEEEEAERSKPQKN